MANFRFYSVYFFKLDHTTEPDFFSRLKGVIGIAGL